MRSPDDFFDGFMPTHIPPATGKSNGVRFILKPGGDIGQLGFRYH
jgi:hypothetical protein